MTRSFLAKYVSPWTLRKDREQQQRIATLRSRDGDDCRRCRRPLRFDLPEGHDKAPVILSLETVAEGEPEPLENLCLCHARCNGEPADQTGEVRERIRRKAEADLFANSRKAAGQKA
jgi:hypothetical protein